MAYDAFLKLDGMDGESTDDKYKGWVEVQSFSMGITHLTTIGSATGGAGSGRTTVGELQIQKVVDKSSAVLFQKCATGEHFAKGKLVARKAGGTQMEYLIYSMEHDRSLNAEGTRIIALKELLSGIEEKIGSFQLHH